MDMAIKIKEKAEELEKFLQYRLSEDDFEKFAVLFKELIMLNIDNIKAVFNDIIEARK